MNKNIVFKDSKGNILKSGTVKSRNPFWREKFNHCGLTKTKTEKVNATWNKHKNKRFSVDYE